MKEYRQTRFQSKADQCGICYNAIENQGLLDSCTHSFCSDCIQKWSNIENTCPLCKQKFTQIESKWKRVNLQIQVGSLQKSQDFKIKMQPKQVLCNICRIYVKDKTQSQKEDQLNVLLEILIEFILSDIN